MIRLEFPDLPDGSFIECKPLRWGAKRRLAAAIDDSLRLKEQTDQMGDDTPIPPGVLTQMMEVPTRILTEVGKVIVAWDFVGEDGEVLPVPSEEPDVLDELSDEQAQALMDAASSLLEGAASRQKKSTTRSSTTSGSKRKRRGNT